MFGLVSQKLSSMKIIVKIIYFILLESLNTFPLLKEKAAYCMQRYRCSDLILIWMLQHQS